jgi:hypothetical protein
MLKWHYRSVYPELIDFSNQHFYDGKLNVFPSPETLSSRKPALQFVRVEGYWQNQCNPVEADWIAGQVIRFFQEGSGETLGVICFNIRQQEKIEEAVLELSMRESVLIPDWFFVKNIENVQGDERDHIWFSIAYARNEAGKMMSQFGSLGFEGGENRLNVAISRAKKSVRIFSSLLPSEWSYLETSAKGPQLLKAYLQFVFSTSQEEVMSAERASGSLLKIADEIAFTENESSLIFENKSRLFGVKSMKAFFGLMPLFLKELGYEISFRYWPKGKFH